MNAQTSFATVMQALAAHRYAVQLPWGARVEATYYGIDGATFAIGDRVFCEYAAAANLWTISSTAT